jgi:zinc transporter, ZIP family
MVSVATALILALFAGLATALGSLVALFIKECKGAYLAFALGFSAGVMVFISFVELLGSSISTVGFFAAVCSFFAGIALIFAIDNFIPHSYKGEACERPDLYRIGVLLAIGITIHNLPEGIAVAFSAVSSWHLGLTAAIAIALHNIPEGISISMPIYYATKSRAKAFWYSLVSGLSEPFGALLALLLLGSVLDEQLLAVILSAVAGIMVFISFDELLPIALENKPNHTAVLGIFIGMAVMAASIMLI